MVVSRLRLLLTERKEVAHSLQVFVLVVCDDVQVTRSFHPPRIEFGLRDSVQFASPLERNRLVARAVDVKHRALGMSGRCVEYRYGLQHFRIVVRIVITNQTTAGEGGSGIEGRVENNARQGNLRIQAALLGFGVLFKQLMRNCAGRNTSN